MTRRWCFGVPQHGSRTMSREEQEAVRVLRARALGRALVLPILAVLLPFGLGVLGLSLGWWRPAGAALLAFALIGLIVSILVAMDSGRRYRSLGRELRDPTLASFELELDAEHAGLVGKTFALSPAPAPGPFEFVIALASSRLFTVQGSPATKFMTVTSNLVADPVVATGGVGSPRALSLEEREELDRHARESWRLAVQKFAAIVAIGGVAAVRGPHLYRVAVWKAAVAAVFATIGVFAAWSLFSALRAARRFRADSERGTVVGAQLEVEAASGLEPITVERLDVSGELWSIDGRPASWRTSSRVARG